MPELAELLERADRAVEEYVPLPATGFGELTQRRDRKRRNQRIRAGVLGAAVALAVALAGARALLTEPTPVDSPSPTLPIAPAGSGDFLLDLATGERSNLPEAFASLEDPGGYAISGDGSSVVFTANAGTEIYVANIDGTGMRRVADQPDGAFELSWSPDGSAIVFGGFEPGGGHRTILVLDLATGQITPVVHDPEMRLISPSFSPDGGTILFTAQFNPRTLRGVALWTVPATGGEPAPLLAHAALGSYSPDGSTIVYMHGLDYWLADADGSRARRLMHGSSAGMFAASLESRRPVWSPDGTRIALTLDEGCCVRRPVSQIHVVDAATGLSTRVGTGYLPVWLDDDTLIVQDHS